eukprot:TRINITY_DN9412_c0_g1_i2.p2 TRINITY_DN9412_c0_g1~~TRINITY_DN9412_c0_g1_i2.p2  ORF type:complete len:139 (+),score=23.95 TRINITY_DN9412_c0_g1_i2:100-516(+)
MPSLVGSEMCIRDSIYGLYLLHLSVQFFTPVGLPEADEEDDEDDQLNNVKLPETQQESHEDRGPLIRSMGEFKFWQNATLASLGSIVCSYSQLFDLPVFWPFLLAYFIMLFILTIKRQIRHMFKYNYSWKDFLTKSKK